MGLRLTPSIRADFIRAMRQRIWLATFTVLLAGCVSGARKERAPAATPSPPKQQVIITPDSTLQGKVVTVSPVGQYVVLSFPIGRLPVIEQQLNVYHHGLKSAELRVSGPQIDNTIVADILSGEVTVGDRVSAR